LEAYLIAESGKAGTELFQQSYTGSETLKAEALNRLPVSSKSVQADMIQPYTGRAALATEPPKRTPAISKAIQVDFDQVQEFYTRPESVQTDLTQQSRRFKRFEAEPPKHSPARSAAAQAHSVHDYTRSETLEAAPPKHSVEIFEPVQGNLIQRSYAMTNNVNSTTSSTQINRINETTIG
jgi:hypothetical protein